jgi:hypothetical protein
MLLRWSLGEPFGNTQGRLRGIRGSFPEFPPVPPSSAEYIWASYLIPISKVNEIKEY